MLDWFFSKLGKLFTIGLCGIPQIGCTNTAEFVEPPAQINLSVPENYTIQAFSKLPTVKNSFISGPRMMAEDTNGNLYVTTGRLNKVFKIKDTNHDGFGDSIEIFKDGLNVPNGIAIHEDYIFIANQDNVLKINLNEPEVEEVIIDNLPTGHHTTKTLKVGPDEKLYLNVGSSCNVCNEEDPLRATILRYDLKGKPEGSLETFGRHKTSPIYATGLRNAQGFAWHPITLDMYGTNNGSDSRAKSKGGKIDDSIPPEHLNTIKANKNYGWPHCWGNNQEDPNFPGSENFCKNMHPPSLLLPSHSTPIGISFLEKTKFEDNFKKNALIALHGSWNKKEHSGYKVILVEFNEENKPTGYSDFVTGWLKNGASWGRPVDIIQSNDGGVFISDDRSGYIYKVIYQK